MFFSLPDVFFPYLQPCSICKSESNICPMSFKTSFEFWSAFITTIRTLTGNSFNKGTISVFDLIFESGMQFPNTSVVLLDS